MLRKKQITKKNKEVGLCIVTAKKIRKSNVGILEETTQTEHSKQNQLLQHASKKKKSEGLKSQTFKKANSKLRDQGTSTNAMSTRHVNQVRPIFLKKTRSKNDSADGNVKLGTTVARKSKNKDSIYQVYTDSMDKVPLRLSDEENTILRTDTSVSSITDVMDNTKSRSNEYSWECDGNKYEEIENANESKRSNINISKGKKKEKKSVDEMKSADRKESKFNFLCMSIYVS